MAKLADYIACSLIYHKGNKFEIDEERTIMPCIYEDSDEYIKEYWGDDEFIGKFPVTYKGKEVQVLVFKDYEEYFGVFKDEENKGMKTYIVVQELSSDWEVQERAKTNLKTNFYVGQQVFLLRDNKIAEKTISRIILEKNEDRECCKVLLRHDSKHTKGTDVFATKEELVESLMKE
jgi:hypothetical protein